MKKINLIVCVAIAATILFAILILFASNESSAKSVNGVPFENGMTYHALGSTSTFDFTIVTPPGSNGWAVVDIEEPLASNLGQIGFRSSSHLGLNINQLTMIELVRVRK